MLNERGNTELHLDADEIGSHLPYDTGDDAYLQFGTVEVHFDVSTREGRAKALEQLTRLRSVTYNLEAHLRVIRIAPERVARPTARFMTAGPAVAATELEDRR